MSQPANFGVPVIGPASPTDYAVRDNDSFSALLSSHSGDEAPDYAVAGTRWLDTSNASAWAMKVYDGSTWHREYVIDPTGHILSDPDFVAKAPAGTVIGGAFFSYSAYTTISADIPLDDTVPAVGEGATIMLGVYTPKSTTSKLCFVVDGNFTSAGGLVTCIGALSVQGVTVATKPVTVPATGYLMPFDLTHEFTPGTVSTQSVALRVGKQTGGATAVINGNHTSGLMGGTLRWTMKVLEVKG